MFALSKHSLVILVLFCHSYTNSLVILVVLPLIHSRRVWGSQIKIPKDVVVV